ncbi:hypothetical protein H8356DRAFT_1364018 [Neocallimastix lanati (nom. inval.)]|nr:hypothetical protein H8356DRAFT_1364018 [Neocallimastix sp. JGI-2020a]
MSLDYQLKNRKAYSTISSELSFIGFLMDLVVEPPSPLKIRKKRRKLLTTRVGVREEDTIKGNDEICVLSLSLSKKKGGMTLGGGFSGVYLIYLKYRKKEESFRKKSVDDFTLFATNYNSKKESIQSKVKDI